MPRQPASRYHTGVQAHAVLYPCDTAALARVSRTLSDAFSCSTSAGTGILDRSKALTQMFEMPDPVPLSVVTQLVHAMHDTQFVYDASPLAEVLETLGYVIRVVETAEADAPAAASAALSNHQLSAVAVKDFQESHLGRFAAHWQGLAGVPSAGDVLVRTYTAMSKLSAV